MSRAVSKDSVRGSVVDALEHVKKMLPGSDGADFSDYYKDYDMKPLERAAQKLNKKGRPK